MAFLPFASSSYKKPIHYSCKELHYRLSKGFRNTLLPSITLLQTYVDSRKISLLFEKLSLFFLLLTSLSCTSKAWLQYVGNAAKGRISKRLSTGKNVPFLENLTCFVAIVLRFTLLPYYRRIGLHTFSQASQRSTKKKIRPIFLDYNGTVDKSL